MTTYVCEGIYYGSCMIGVILGFLIGVMASEILPKIYAKLYELKKRDNSQEGK